MLTISSSLDLLVSILFWVHMYRICQFDYLYIKAPKEMSKVPIAYNLFVDKAVNIYVLSTEAYLKQFFVTKYIMYISLSPNYKCCGLPDRDM